MFIECLLFILLAVMPVEAVGTDVAAERASALRFGNARPWAFHWARGLNPSPFPRHGARGAKLLASTAWISESVADLRDLSRRWTQSGGAALAAVVLVIVCGSAWCLNIVSLPGNWVAVGAMALYGWIGPETGCTAIGLLPIGLAFGFALVGEVFEFAAGAVGAQRAGASRRATLYSIGGSIVGAVVGGVIGLPIPVLGPILAALLFGGLGATIGAIWAEWNDGRPWRDSWRIGRAAFWGRTAGTVGKMIAGLAVVLTSVIAVLF